MFMNKTRDNRLGMAIIAAAISLPRGRGERTGEGTGIRRRRPGQ